MTCHTVDCAKPGRRPNVMLWVALAVCMAAGPLFLYTLTAVSPLLVADLGLSPTQYGAIASVVFGSAALSALTLGGPSGRLGARTVMVAVSLGSATGLAVLAIADSYPVVLAAAVLSGAVQALSNPATNRVVAGVPSRQRGALIGWKQSGVQMAQFVAGLLAPTIGAFAGWRWALAVGTGIGVVGAVTARAIPPEGTPAPGSEGNGALGGTGVGSLTAYTFFMGFGLQATNAHLPLFAHLRLGLDAQTAGLTAAVVGLVGLLSRIAAGRLTVHGNRTGGVLLGLAVGSAFGVGMIFTAGFVGSWLVWLGASIFGIAAMASNAVTMVALVHTVPAASLSAATGLLVTGMYLGFGSGPLAFGVARDHGIGFDAGWLIPITAFGIAALVGVPAALSRPIATPLKGTNHADA